MPGAVMSRTFMQQLFFDFHNDVNRKKGYTQFSRSELDQKYSLAVTRLILQNFFAKFATRNKNLPKMIADDMYRRRVVENLKTWFLTNLDKFEE